MNILTTDDVKTLLKISDKQAKALMRADGFPSIKLVGNIEMKKDY